MPIGLVSERTYPSMLCRAMMGMMRLSQTGPRFDLTYCASWDYMIGTLFAIIIKCRANCFSTPR